MTKCNLQAIEFSSIKSKKILAARIVCSVRRIVIHLAGSYPFKHIFAHVLSRLRALATPAVASG